MVVIVSQHGQPLASRHEGAVSTLNWCQQSLQMDGPSHVRKRAKARSSRPSRIIQGEHMDYAVRDNSVRGLSKGYYFFQESSAERHFSRTLGHWTPAHR